MAKDNRVRLQKILADNAIASRRKAEDLIRNGSVKVNGKIATIGDKADPTKDKIFVNGRKITAGSSKNKYYIMRNESEEREWQKQKQYLYVVNVEMNHQNG